MHANRSQGNPNLNITKNNQELLYKSFFKNINFPKIWKTTNFRMQITHLVQQLSKVKKVFNIFVKALRQSYIRTSNIRKLFFIISENWCSLIINIKISNFWYYNITFAIRKSFSDIRKSFLDIRKHFQKWNLHLIIYFNLGMFNITCIRKLTTLIKR